MPVFDLTALPPLLHEQSWPGVGERRLLGHEPLLRQEPTSRWWDFLIGAAYVNPFHDFYVSLNRYKWRIPKRVAPTPDLNAPAHPALAYQQLAVTEEGIKLMNPGARARLLTYAEIGDICVTYVILSQSDYRTDVTYKQRTFNQLNFTVGEEAHEYLIDSAADREQDVDRAIRNVANYDYGLREEDQSSDNETHSTENYYVSITRMKWRHRRRPRHYEQITGYLTSSTYSNPTFEWPVNSEIPFTPPTTHTLRLDHDGIYILREGETILYFAHGAGTDYQLNDILYVLLGSKEGEPTHHRYAELHFTAADATPYTFYIQEITPVENSSTRRFIGQRMGGAFVLDMVKKDPLCLPGSRRVNPVRRTYYYFVPDPI